MKGFIKVNGKGVLPGAYSFLWPLLFQKIYTLHYVVLLYSYGDCADESIAVRISVPMYRFLKN